MSVMRIMSWAHLVVTITEKDTGKVKTVTGLGASSPPIALQQQGSQGKFFFGMDGNLYGTYDPGLGGILMVRLTPTSETVPWAIKQEEYRKTCQREGLNFRCYDASVTNLAHKSKWTLHNGYAYEGTEWFAPGEEYVMSFIFEEVKSHRGVSWAPSPIRSNSDSQGSGDSEPPTRNPHTA